MATVSRRSLFKRSAAIGGASLLLGGAVAVALFATRDPDRNLGVTLRIDHHEPDGRNLS